MEVFYISNLILSSIVNFSNFTSDGIFKVSFQVYLVIFHDLFWGLLFGFIGAGIYANNRNKSTIATYLILVGAILGVILPTHIVGIFGIILGFILAVIFYKSFIES